MMKKLEWVGSSLDDLLAFPKAVRQEFGYALHLAQLGDKYHKSKPFKGLGSGVYEIAMEYDTNAYRSIYVVSFGDAVYVLHCFNKKSKQGRKTPPKEVEIVKQRLKYLKQRLSQG